jgi:hypothetical protein
VNRASLGPIAAHNDPETVTKIVTEVKGTVNEPEQAGAELLEVPAEGSGGAGRVRTAASQFCRLLP